ncbi:MAG: hypothetical protein Q8807_01505 ['Waltheria sp.' little leaf phytoplasma]|nr:hypothetical protein ['Waltheria sp.' little leaf phytoplasma]
MSIFYKIKKKYLKKIEKYAIKKRIPIIQKETGLFLENFINQKKMIDILEIGTALGYSALTMCNPNNQIETLERKYNYYQLAKKIFFNTPFKVKVRAEINT